MTFINYYSIIHFIIWFTYGKYFNKSWSLFLLLSVGWEIIELFIPFNFAIESIMNKIMDIMINIIGYSFGLLFKK
jgi:type III secretory pathway component EscU